jgi:hypothetical protein
MKRSSNFSVPLTISAVAIVIISCASGKAGIQNPNVWPVGKTVVYELTRSQTQTVEIPGQGEQVNESSTTFTISVESIGTRQFKLTVLEATTTSLNTSVDPVIGLESMVQLDERGLISEASGLEGNAFVEERGGTGLFTEDLQPLFFYAPEEALKPGVQWSRDYSVSATQSNIEVTRAFNDAFNCIEETTLEGNRAFRINAVSNIDFSGPGEMSGMPIDLKMTGSLDGSLYVDSATGLVLMYEMKGQVSGAIFSDQFDLPMTLDASMALKIKK